MNQGAPLSELSLQGWEGQRGCPALPMAGRGLQGMPASSVGCAFLTGRADQGSTAAICTQASWYLKLLGVALKNRVLGEGTC